MTTRENMERTSKIRGWIEKVKRYFFPVKEWGDSKQECQVADFQQRGTSSPHEQLSGETPCLLEAENMHGFANAKNMHVGKHTEEKPIQSYKIWRYTNELRKSHAITHGMLGEYSEEVSLIDSYLLLSDVEYWAFDINQLIHHYKKVSKLTFTGQL